MEKKIEERVKVFINKMKKNIQNKETNPDVKMNEIYENLNNEQLFEFTNDLIKQKIT